VQPTPLARPGPGRDLHGALVPLLGSFATAASGAADGCLLGGCIYGPGETYALDAQYNFCYTCGMKTAISIPDPLFQAAEQYAQAKGFSRSELYAKAIQHYLDTFRYQGVTEALNSLYGEEESTLDLGYIAAQGSILSKEEW
jgi:hypothetical protein